MGLDRSSVTCRSELEAEVDCWRVNLGLMFDLLFEGLPLFLKMCLVEFKKLLL